MGEKLASKLVDSVQSKRNLPAEVFLRALAIDELGKHVSAILAREYGDIERIRAVTVEEFSQIHTIGEIIARKVVQGLEQRAALIDALLAEVTLVWPGPELAGDTGGKLEGKSFMFTGAMASMKRGPAQKLVTEHGGKAASSVSGTLDFLVLGDKDMPRYLEGWRSSKLKKAEKLMEKGAALQIISESQFLEMVQADE
jgi:DNA ligase (NAD+)